MVNIDASKRLLTPQLLAHPYITDQEYNEESLWHKLAVFGWVKMQELCGPDLLCELWWKKCINDRSEEQMPTEFKQAT